MFYRKLIIFFLLYLVSLYASSDAHMPYDESVDAKKNLSYTLNLAFTETQKITQRDIRPGGY